MACANGRVNPNTATKLRLFAASAGYCQRPDCRRPLFERDGSNDYHLAEMAHIIAAGEKGPRADRAMGNQEKSEFENLILLCANCHTEIDKAPVKFPTEMILEWKTGHHSAIARALNLQRQPDRQAARDALVPILRTNAHIHEKWGPNNEYSENPEAEEAQVWKRKMIEQIIPNNQSILLLLQNNTHLMTPKELEVTEHFAQHLNDLIHRHLGDGLQICSRFPPALSTMFEDMA